MVESVRWTVSKDRFLYPTIFYTPVVLVDGDNVVTLDKAYVYNARYVIENGIGRGALVTIVRSGDVIPKVVRVLKAVEPDLPDKDQFGDYAARVRSSLANGTLLDVPEHGPGFISATSQRFGAIVREFFDR